MRTDGTAEKHRWLIVDALLPARTFLAEVEKDLSGLVGKDYPILVIFIECNAELTCNMAKRMSCYFPVAAVERLSKRVLENLLATQVHGGELGTAGRGDGTGTLEGLDLEARERFEHAALCFGPNRHHRLRVCGEGQVAHLGESAGQDLRVTQDVGAERKAE